MTPRIDLVTRGLDRACAHPSPHQYDIFVRCVVETVPAAARRIDHVAFARGLFTLVGIDMTMAFDDDEEFIAVVMPMVFVTRARLEHGPTDDMIGARRLLVDQE